MIDRQGKDKRVHLEVFENLKTDCQSKKCSKRTNTAHEQLLQSVWPDPDQTVCLAVINISSSPAVCSLLFFVVVLVLVSILYRRDPQCCKVCSYQDPHRDMVSALCAAFLPSFPFSFLKRLGRVQLLSFRRHCVRSVWQH